MKNLQVEINARFQQSDDVVGPFIFTPPLNEDYWLFRVKLFKDQAMLAFPKFGTIGIGFAQEDDWNTNLPYTRNAEVIYDHIKHNKAHDEITDEECLEAIRLIQVAAQMISKC